MISLKDKIVFITGASSGIGEAASIEFAKQGSRLILTARREERLNELAKKIECEFGVKCFTFSLDVRNQIAVQKAIENLLPEWAEIDILINNAGLSRGLEKVQEGNIQAWDEMIDTNVKGVLYVTRAILPGMVQRNRGHIVNLGSISSHTVYPSGNVYCATKHALWALSQGMQMDVLGTKVRVSCVSPGFVETEFSVVRFYGDKTKADKVYEGMTPLTAEDIAETIVYCCTRPEHVNVSEILIMPTDQAAAHLVNRKKDK